jgi:hypothetical protein
MAMASRETDGSMLCARPEVEVLRDIERFSDYQKAKSRVRQVLARYTGISADPQPRWRHMLSEKNSSAIVAFGTLALVIIGIATLLVTLR